VRLTFRISLLAIGLASLLGAGATSAGTLVEFSNLPGHTPANLSGYLARPDAGLSAELGGPSNGGTQYPAVVVLHGCNGMFGHSAVLLPVFVPRPRTAKFCSVSASTPH
jgi:hypothetical protein